MFTKQLVDFGTFRASESRNMYIELKNPNKMKIDIQEIRSTSQMVRVAEIQKKVLGGHWETIKNSTTDVPVCADCNLRLALNVKSPHEGQFVFDIIFIMEKVLY